MPLPDDFWDLEGKEPLPIKEQEVEALALMDLLKTTFDQRLQEEIEEALERR